MAEPMAKSPKRAWERRSDGLAVGNSRLSKPREEGRINEVKIRIADDLMTSSLISRVERLEGRAKAKEPRTFCYGWVTPLPKDYTGERHVVTVQREPTRHTLSCANSKNGPDLHLLAQTMTRPTWSTLRSDGDAPTSSRVRAAQCVPERVRNADDADDPGARIAQLRKEGRIKPS
jgi:hypothetical protein